MLTLEFSAQDLAVTRFASSPLWEITNSVQVLKEPGEHAVHLPWVRSARGRLRGVGFELLSQLVPIPTVHTPDFLTPVPVGSAPGIRAELDQLLATDPAQVVVDLDRYQGELPPLVAEFRSDPEAGLVRLAAEVLAYWDAAVAPFWPRIQRLVEGEILYRARQMATGGPASLFSDLHPRVSWERGTLRVAHRWFRAERSLDGERGLVLVPSVFAWPGVYSQTDPPHQPGLIYPPRGVATLWERATPVPDGLAGVLGRARALLLAELDSPASTTELALRTGLSAPNVSHHLSALSGAGLVSRHRAGRAVLYLRTALTDALLAGCAAPDA
ncbi:ArsR family transcriptional regulator [Kitasatospora sp. MAP5-34]|uniref:ArsR/SmtB family transcription factor n=1 Tax=Kitasatospora sp. MAP5-34 TaxID=3035102 RepID=UPI002476A6D9|nr:ArsR family transcriptional regulator [Kitasatospora sp. MAP5-34]MDH6577955.1 DNA-binding transcriptional ArsR family regulator [Kitasatospora sp. MAP5-34]